MSLFRIHIRPKGGKADSELSFKYCLKNNLLGVGWQVWKEPNEILDWKTYAVRAEEEYGGDIAIHRYIEQNVSKDDLVWTRDTKGHYYLCKVLSPWEYLETEEAKDADIVNIFKVDMRKIEDVDGVPGKVIACFRASRTIEEVADNPAIIYSKALWNQLVSKEEYAINEKLESIWSLLNDEQVEDLIFIYLQTKDFIVVPHSRKKDTMSYEFYLINKVNSERTLVQVKTGYSNINLDDFMNYKENIFFFQPNNCYLGIKRENHYMIDKDEIEQFIINNQSIIPSNILRWYELIK
jgi:hypothetical protein